MSYTYTGDSLNIVATSVGAVMPALGAYVSLPGVASNYVSTPDSAANSVSTTIDLRVRCALSDWTPSATQVLLAKDDGTTNRCYQFAVLTTGNLQFLYTNNGSTTTGRIANSGAATGIPDGTVYWVRVTYNTTTGAVNFYKSEDGATWTSVGTEQTITSGTMFNGTNAVTVGAISTGASQAAGAFYFAEVRDGIGGTVVAQMDPSGQPASATTVPNIAGQTQWTVNQSGGTPAVIIDEAVGYGRAGMFSTKGMLVLNAAPPAGSTIRNGWGVSPNGMRCITKAAVSPTDRVMVAGRAYTLNGRAYCATPAVAGATARWIDRIPYQADGAMKVTEK